MKKEIEKNKEYPACLETCCDRMIGSKKCRRNKNRTKPIIGIKKCRTEEKNMKKKLYWHTLAAFLLLFAQACAQIGIQWIHQECFSILNGDLVCNILFDQITTISIMDVGARIACEGYAFSISFKIRCDHLVIDKTKIKYWKSFKKIVKIDFLKPLLNY